MRRYLLLLFCFFTLSLTANDYIFNYIDNNSLHTSYYGIAGEANIQYKLLTYIIPLDEDVLSVNLREDNYQSQYQNIRIFSGYATITDGQIIQTNKVPSPLFPAKNSITYQTYFKQGVQVLVAKIPHQRYNYSEKRLDILQEAKVQISTQKREGGEEKSRYLTNLADFDRITEGVFVEESVRESYYTYYSNPHSNNRNLLGVDPAEMLIISPSGLISDWQTYADYKTALGVTTEVVDISNITSTYAGRDNAEKLRNFLTEIYTEWSSYPIPLSFVLLGGDYNLIPLRTLRITAVYNSSLHTNNIYSDLYYAGLDGDWDNDSDNFFGEGDNAQDSQATGMSGEEADLYAEIAVGRIPVATTLEFENWIYKQQDYASADVSEQFYEKVLLVGEYLGSSIYGAPSMNELGNSLSDYSLQTLYAQNSTFTEANLISAINSGVSQVHHLGHGSTSAVFSIDESDLIDDFINQDYPMVYTQGCHTANLATNDSIGENFIINQRGAFAYIGNTSYGFYSSFENQGPSQIFHREFVDAYTQEAISQIGLAFNDGKEDLVGITDQTGTKRYVYFDNILFADPSTELIKDLEKVSVEQLSDTSIKLSFSTLMSSEIFNVSNYSVYPRDDVFTTYPVTSVTNQATDYFLNFSSPLPVGVPLRVTIENIPNLLNPTVKIVKSIYTIKELSVITPTIWTADESPIYVYKNQIINSTLTIESGTEVRVNSGKSFITYRGGTLQVEGDSLNYVTFTSYSDDSAEADQWTELFFFLEPSLNSYINYATIKNSRNGIWLDSLSTISLDHVRFKDIQNYGIYAEHSTINADYLEFSGLTNSEKGAFNIIGGTQNLNHLTSAGNAGYELSVSESAQTHLSNSIIWGDSYFDSEYLTIDYTILSEYYAGTENLTTNPQFVSTSDLSLQSISPAINTGNSSELDADNTITDRGYWSFYQPNDFSAHLVLNSSPKMIQFENLSLGNYDSVQWDFDNDGSWDSTDSAPQHLYLAEGTFSIKMRLLKDSFQQDILLTDLISQTFTPLQINFPVALSLNSTQLELNWDAVNNSDLYQITGGLELDTTFLPITTQAETLFQTDLLEDRTKFWQIIPLEQNITITD